MSWSGPKQGFKAHVDRYKNSPVMHKRLDQCGLRFGAGPLSGEFGRFWTTFAFCSTEQNLCSCVGILPASDAEPNGSEGNGSPTILVSDTRYINQTKACVTDPYFKHFRFEGMVFL